MGGDARDHHGGHRSALRSCCFHRTLCAASSAIERYTRDALEAGVGIAKNTEAVTALDETIAAAGSLLEAF